MIPGFVLSNLVKNIFLSMKILKKIRLIEAHHVLQYIRIWIWHLGSQWSIKNNTLKEIQWPFMKYVKMERMQLQIIITWIYKSTFDLISFMISETCFLLKLYPLLQKYMILLYYFCWWYEFMAIHLKCNFFL